MRASSPPTLLLGYFGPAVGDPPDAAQQHRARGDDVRYQLQHPPGGFRQRFHRNVGAQPDLFERYRREVEHAGAAYFLHAVDLVVIPAGLPGDPLARFGEQFVAVAAHRGAHRTGLGARRLLALALPLRAHIALAHLRQALVPLVGGHLERAGLHAISAAHALIRVVYYRPQRRLLQRAHGTHRSTRRLLAIHAQPTAVMLAVGFHGC